MSGFLGSGFQRGVWLYLPWKVMRRPLPPDDGMTKICGEPWRFDTKAICEPSGEKLGELSMAGWLVRRALMLPSAALMRNSSELPGYDSVSTSDPSDDQAAPVFIPGCLDTRRA